MARVAVMRVAQLDAGRLDGELTSMLQEQLAKAFAYFRPVRSRRSHLVSCIIVMTRDDPSPAGWLVCLTLCWWLVTNAS